MLLSELMSGIDALIPNHYAESWDKVGLQIGDPGRDVERVLIALDLTAETIEAARAHRSDVVICHHPPIFNPLAGLRFDQANERLVCEALLANLAVIALHTNLDAVPGGVADQFARLIGLEDVMTFVPISTALPVAAGTWPASFAVPAGFGRTGTLPQPIPLHDLVEQLRRRLESPYIMVAAAGRQPVSRITVCPGSFDGAWAPLVAAQGSEALIVGEIKYHDRLALMADGVTVIAVGHDVSERVVLKPLAGLLAGAFPQLAFAVDMGFKYNEMAF